MSDGKRETLELVVSGCYNPFSPLFESKVITPTLTKEIIWYHMTIP